MVPISKLAELKRALQAGLVRMRFTSAEQAYAEAFRSGSWSVVNVEHVCDSPADPAADLPATDPGSEA